VKDDGEAQSGILLTSQPREIYHGLGSRRMKPRRNKRETSWPPPCL
jgi:hypothetical protein